MIAKNNTKNEGVKVNIEFVMLCVFQYFVSRILTERPCCTSLVPHLFNIFIRASESERRRGARFLWHPQPICWFIRTIFVSSGTKHLQCRSWDCVIISSGTVVESYTIKKSINRKGEFLVLFVVRDATQSAIFFAKRCLHCDKFTLLLLNIMIHRVRRIFQGGGEWIFANFQLKSMLLKCKRRVKRERKWLMFDAEVKFDWHI